MKTKKINNRTIIGIVCIVLALVVTFGVSPLVNRISDQKTDIVRVKNTIERGQQITANDLETTMFRLRQARTAAQARLTMPART